MPIRRFRKRRPPPRATVKLRIEGFTAAQLGAKLGVSARTVRYYTAQRLLPPPQFRGRATRYLREHLIQLAAIRQLQHGRRLSLDAIRHQLARLSAPQLEQLAIAALPQLAPPQPPAPALAPVVPTMTSHRWQRVTVLPGLEVHLLDGAGDETRLIANELANLAALRWQERLAAASGSEQPSQPALTPPG